jgi:hypothetical protein
LGFLELVVPGSPKRQVFWKPANQVSKVLFTKLLTASLHNREKSCVYRDLASIDAVLGEFSVVMHDIFGADPVTYAQRKPSDGVRMAP